jgi:hypothetical protein
MVACAHIVLVVASIVCNAGGSFSLFFTTEMNLDQLREQRHDLNRQFRICRRTRVDGGTCVECTLNNLSLQFEIDKINCRIVWMEYPRFEQIMEIGILIKWTMFWVVVFVVILCFVFKSIEMLVDCWTLFVYDSPDIMDLQTQMGLRSTRTWQQANRLVALKNNASTTLLIPSWTKKP